MVVLHFSENLVDLVVFGFFFSSFFINTARQNGFNQKVLSQAKDYPNLKVWPPGVQKTINENPPASIFFVNPPEGSEHSEKCIESKKNNTLYYKKPVATPTFCKRNFSSCFFWLQVSKIAAKLKLEKKSYFGYGISEKKFACRKFG